MSRMTLCLLTAGVLVVLSIGLMAGRYCVLGSEIMVPRGPSTYKVTLVAHGTLLDAKARLRTVAPLDFGKQHVLNESSDSSELRPRVSSSRHPENRHYVWSPCPGAAQGPFQLRYQFFCTLDAVRPEEPGWAVARAAAPKKGEFLQNESSIECNDHGIAEMARQLTANSNQPSDQLEALFHFVEKDIANDPNLGVSPAATECLKLKHGDARAKSRLLVALCRSRGIPSRLVTGLALRSGREQQVHVWAEAWVRDHWQPLCPYYHHRGRIPATFVTLGFGDLVPIRGRNVADLAYGFLVEHMDRENADVDPMPLRRCVKAVSLDSLPPSERHLVEFLLLLPIAALIVCLFRNVIGIASFGTFAPALVGLAFRDLYSAPGIIIFLGIILLGWVIRRALDRYHLLQVPRTALLLTLVVVMLITVISVFNARSIPITQYISLFPMVILTGMIERFWTLENEDGAASSFRTLLNTLAISATIAVVLSWRPLTNHLVRFPETLGIIMAVQMLLGRYTGYRLSELYRFRDLVISH